MGFLTKLFRAATPENPRFSLNDPGAWEAFVGGEPSTSGVTVTRQTALTLPAFWRGVSLVANGVAKLPLFIYERVGEGKKRAVAHAGYKLLLYQPNEYQTAFVLKRTMMMHALCRGNGYSYIFRNGGGEPRELLLLDPEVTYPLRVDGRLWYVTKVGKEERKLAGEDVLHWAGPGWDGLCGYDVLTYAREALGEGMAKQRFSASFFGNGARPSVVIEVPTKMKPEAKKEILEGWDRMHRGLENAHKTAIIDGGGKIHEFSMTAENAQLIESRKFSLIEVANILGVPPHKLGSDSTTAYASLEQEDRAYLGDGLDPWLCNIEQDARMKVLTEEEKEADSHLAEFDRRKLIRTDQAARASYLRTALGGRPWMIPDEAREEEGMNPLGGECGEYLNPLNMGKGGTDNEPDDQGGPRPGSPKNNQALRAAIAHTAEDAGRRVVVRIGLQARRAAKDGGRYVAWLETFVAEQRPVVAEMIAPAVEAAEALAGNHWLADDAAAWILDALHKPLSSIADRVPAKDLASAVDQFMNEAETLLPPSLAHELLGD